MINNKYFSVKASGDLPNGIAYQRPQISQSNQSYATYDEHWQYTNGTYNYTPPSYPTSIARLDMTQLNGNQAWKHLAEPNSFGNYERFTDLTGGTAYSTDDYFIDHLTGLGYKYTVDTNTFANALTNANASTHLGYSDWRVCNIMELRAVFGYRRWYNPLFSTSNADNLYSNTTRYDLTTYALGVSYTNGGANVPKTSAEKYVFVRNHYS